MTMHRDEFLIIKPTRCTNFSNLFLKWNCVCFGQFLYPSSGVFYCTHSNGVCHTGSPTVCEQDRDRTAVPSWSCLQAVSKPVWHIPLLCVRWKTPDYGQRNCPKHVEFHSKNKFEKLVHLVGFFYKKQWNLSPVKKFSCLRRQNNLVPKFHSAINIHVVILLHFQLKRILHPRCMTNL